MIRTKDKLFFTVVFGLFVLLCMPAHASRFDWYRSGDVREYRSGIWISIDFYIPESYGWTPIPIAHDLIRDNRGEASPIHISIDNVDSSQTHITFGTDSRAGNLSQLYRYSYYGAYPGNERWQISGGPINGGHHGNFLTFEAFRNEVLANIQYFTSQLNSAPAFYSVLISDAQLAIGQSEPSSVLVTWWNNYHAPVPASPAPSGATANGTSTSGAIHSTPTPAELSAIGLSGLGAIGSRYLDEL